MLYELSELALYTVHQELEPLVEGTGIELVPVLGTETLARAAAAAQVARYFMTITEAVQLVLQADAEANGGEVFVLDMGEPVLIMQLARQVIERAGYTVRDAEAPSGDIAIEITGLRPASEPP